MIWQCIASNMPLIKIPAARHKQGREVKDDGHEERKIVASVLTQTQPGAWRLLRGRSYISGRSAKFPGLPESYDAGHNLPSYNLLLRWSTSFVVHKV